MRFGAALDLWHKGDLFDLTDSRGDAPRKTEPEVSPELLALAKEAYDQIPTIETIEELKDFYTGAKDAGLLAVVINGKTLNAVITARKTVLEKK